MKVARVDLVLLNNIMRYCFFVIIKMCTIYNYDTYACVGFHVLCSLFCFIFFIRLQRQSVVDQVVRYRYRGRTDTHCIPIFI